MCPKYLTAFTQKSIFAPDNYPCFIKDKPATFYWPKDELGKAESFGDELAKQLAAVTPVEANFTFAVPALRKPSEFSSINFSLK